MRLHIPQLLLKHGPLQETELMFIIHVQTSISVQEASLLSTDL
jgi:hypothetical protein